MPKRRSKRRKRHPDWSKADWSLNNCALARKLKCHRNTVKINRDRLNQPKGTGGTLPRGHYPVQSLMGQKFGRLTAEMIVGRNKHRIPLWHCECICGNSKVVLYQNLVQGRVKSCGCLTQIRRTAK